jgi:hypothetical protein
LFDSQLLSDLLEEMIVLRVLWTVGTEVDILEKINANTQIQKILSYEAHAHSHPKAPLQQQQRSRISAA